MAGAQGVEDLGGRHLALREQDERVIQQVRGLAGEGRSTDAAQDERFDALIGGAELRRRLEALRGRW